MNVPVAPGANVDAGNDGYGTPGTIFGHVYYDYNSDGTQEPDGILEEAAFFGPFFTLLSKLGPDANKALFKAGVELYKSFGYTTAQEGRASAGSVSTMSAVAKAGGLDIDVVAHPDSRWTRRSSRRRSCRAVTRNASASAAPR